MSSLDHHRGVGFSIVAIGADRWQWAIHPPFGVKGLEHKHGTVSGARAHAIAAAKREIESQDLAAN